MRTIHLMSARFFKKIYLGLAILFWSLLTLTNLVSYFAENAFLTPSLADFFSNYLLCLFILFSFLYFKIEIGSKDLESKDDYLWRVFITGISCILTSLFIRFFIATGFLESLLLYSVFFHLNLGLLTIYIAGTFYVWKKLILYHKSNRTNILWHIFEYSILFAILSTFFIFDIRQPSFYLYISPLILIAVVLSFNLKWIALLNYNKKIRSIVLMAFI